MRLLHEYELLDERHVVRLGLAQDGAHHAQLARLVVLLVQVTSVVHALRLLETNQREIERELDSQSQNSQVIVRTSSCCLRK